ncbi:hypothetical protein NQZ68_019713 [Dissostichus eleginoides]|nr:hypothetical protein NQZ68_019713 [Dissostichus eleginoides]
MADVRFRAKHAFSLPISGVFASSRSVSSDQLSSSSEMTEHPDGHLQAERPRRCRKDIRDEEGEKIKKQNAFISCVSSL